VRSSAATTAMAAGSSSRRLRYAALCLRPQTRIAHTVLVGSLLGALAVALGKPQPTPPAA